MEKSEVSVKLVIVVGSVKGKFISVLSSVWFGK